MGEWGVLGHSSPSMNLDGPVHHRLRHAWDHSLNSMDLPKCLHNSSAKGVRAEGEYLLPGSDIANQIHFMGSIEGEQASLVNLAFEHGRFTIDQIG